MRYPERMDRPLSDDDRRWLRENNMGDVADRFDREDGSLDEDPEDVEEPEAQPREYSRMTVAELKDMIGLRNKEILAEDPDAAPIPTDGNKSDLIARLKDDDAAVAEAEKNS